MLIEQYWLGLFYPNYFNVKIEQLFVQHLYHTKQTALEGIGFFKLKGDVKLPSENEKEGAVAPDAFSFEFNLRAPEDDSLVDYIVLQTGKIKPLAKSDLESYSMLAKQFLNLGKPLVIGGVGTLQINQKGEYQFTGGHFINPKIDDIFQQVKDRKEDDVSFERDPYTGKKRNNLLLMLTIVGIIIIGLVLYYFLILKNNSGGNKEQETVVVSDTTKTVTKTDTVSTKAVLDTTVKIAPDSNKIVTPIVKPNTTITGPGTFTIALKDYNSQAKVQKAHDRLREWGHKVNIVKIDSTSYKLAMSFIRPLSDTVKVRDSIKRFFGGNPYILGDTK